MTDYALNCYWNPNWISRIWNPDFYSLEYTLSIGGQTLVEFPGLSAGTRGFQGGDTIYFAFLVGGGNCDPPIMLDEATIFFRRGNGNGGNPIGITNGRLHEGEEIWSVTCRSEDCEFKSVNEGKPECAQIFRAQTEASGEELTECFTSIGEDSSWSLSVQASYRVPASDHRKVFAFDPEWVVGNGG